MCSLIYERTLSSICALGDKSLVVTGSFVSYSRIRAEKFCIATNTWTELPMLNEEKYNHSSCSFEHRYVFLFGGNTSGEKDFDIIERLDFLQSDPSW